MLIRFSVENFKSFHGKQTFSMEADDAVTDLPGNTVLTPAGTLVKTAAVYGHNASGKTNLLESLDTLAKFIIYSDREGQNVWVPMFESATEDRPHGYDLILQIGPSLLTYRVSGWRHAIVNESLEHEDLQAKVSTLIFQRQGDDLAGQLGSTGDKSSRQIQERVSAKKSALPGLAAAGLQPAKAVLLWMQQRLIILAGRDEGDIDRYQHLEAFARRLEGSTKLHHQFRELLTAADVGIIDFRLFEPLDRAEAEVRQNWRSAAAERGFVAEEEYESVNRTIDGSAGLRLVHAGAHPDQRFTPLWTDESAGTRRFIEILSLLLRETVTFPHTVVVDELEQSLSPDLLERIVRLFHDPEVNRSGSQLIFTTHERSLLDAPNLFRHDQVWFVEKKPGGDSELYSLADFEEGTLDPGVLLSKRYAAGPYGAVGRFGSAMEATTPDEPLDLRPRTTTSEEGPVGEAR